MGSIYRHLLINLEEYVANGELRSRAGKVHGMLCSFPLNKHPHGAWSLLLNLLSFPTETVIVRFFWWFHPDFDVLSVSHFCGSSSSCGGMSPNRTAFEDLWR